ncbi:MAG: phosphotransferase [Streptosporangiales bacterium]|nr:phosphotransferase [Streptosporangiales bacterium]
MQPPVGVESLARLGPVRGAEPLESSPRSHVWRAEMGGVPVVIKQLAEDPDADDRYAREVAALELAATADPPVVPRLLGADPEARVLILEEVGHHPPPADWIVGYATSLARLRATGTNALPGQGHGALPPWAGPSALPGERGGLPPWAGPGLRDVVAFARLAEGLGVTLNERARAEAEVLVERLADGSRRALLHGDPCPGNDMYGPDGLRFIDFEQASIGDGIVELACLRVGFPTCWCSTAPEPGLLHVAEEAHRGAWRAATGTDVTGDLTDACAGWLLRGNGLVQRAERDGTDRFARVLERDWTWGVATARQRLAHRLDVVATMAAEHTPLAAFGELTRAMRTAIDTRWPGLVPLPTHRP